MKYLLLLLPLLLLLTSVLLLLLLLLGGLLFLRVQTDALKTAGVPCAKLDSTLEAHEVREIYEQVGP